MTYRNWLDKNYSDLVKLAIKIDNTDGEEILHFTLDKFLHGNYTFLDDMDDHNKLKYISRTLSIQSKSKTSQFYREFKRYTILSEDVILADREYEELDNIDEIKLLFIEKELKKINWFSAILFKQYAQNDYSAQKLADYLLIPLSTCQYHIRKVRNHIRKEWDKKKDLYL